MSHHRRIAREVLDYALLAPAFKSLPISEVEKDAIVEAMAIQPTREGRIEAAVVRLEALFQQRMAA